VKRVGAIIFLILFVGNSIGLFLAFNFQRFLIKCAVEIELAEGIPTDKLYQVTVVAENKGLLHWLEDREFNYRGVMYDVVQKKVLNQDTTIYYCWADSKETKLNAALDQFVKKNSDPIAPSKSDVQHPFQLLSPPVFTLQKNIIAPHFFEPKLGWAYLHHYLPPFLSFPAPPPKV
jgi:hypothetical protein